jgi:hypothetical protein
MSCGKVKVLHDGNEQEKMKIKYREAGNALGI